MELKTIPGVTSLPDNSVKGSPLTSQSLTFQDPESPDSLGHGNWFP